MMRAIKEMYPSKKKLILYFLNEVLDAVDYIRMGTILLQFIDKQLVVEFIESLGVDRGQGK